MIILMSHKKVLKNCLKYKLYYFESKIERIIKNTNFAGEKSDSYSEKSLLAIFNYWKQKLISNESSLTESDSLYPESINNIKDKIKKKVAKRSFRRKKLNLEKNIKYY